MSEFLGTYVFISAPAIAWMICQIAKTLYYLYSERQLNVAKLFDAGGMPSAHSAGVIALATVIGYQFGVDSPLFAIAALFAAVVVYDATNLRRSAGNHASVLNRIIPELLRGKMVREFDYKVLKEMLGHNQLEVFIGAAIGFFVAYAMVVNLT